MELSQCWKLLSSGWVSTWATRITFFILVSSLSRQIEGSAVYRNGIIQSWPGACHPWASDSSVEAPWPETLGCCEPNRKKIPCEIRHRAELSVHHHCFPPLPSWNLSCNRTTAGLLCSGTFGLRRKWKSVPLGVYFWWSSKQGIS